MIWTSIFVAGIAQGLFLVTMLFRQQYMNMLATRLLAVAVIAMIVTNADLLVIASGYFRVVPHTFGTSFGMMLLFGPLLYIYARSITDANFSWSWSHLAHFLPYCVNVLLSLPIYTMSAADKTLLIESFISGSLEFDRFTAALTVLQSIHLGSYLIATVRLLKVQERTHGNAEFIVSLGGRILWLKALSVWFLLFLVLIIALLLLVMSRQEHLPEANYSYALAMTVIIYYLAYQLVINPALLGPDFAQRYRFYRKLSPDRESRCLNDIDRLLRQEKVFLDPDLKLSTFAASLELPPHLVSKLINERLSKSFNELINEHRIEAVVTLLGESGSEKRSILDIAFEAGFKSKSTFNSAFKKATGKTPSEFAPDAS